MRPSGVARIFHYGRFESQNGDKMTSLGKFAVYFIVLISSVAALANGTGEEIKNSSTTTVESSQQMDQDQRALALQLLSEFTQATVAAGRCNGSYDCSWPTTQCVKNRCVKSNGDSGQCNGSYDCSWPTSQCKNGSCVKPNGSGGECNGSYDCSWPYSSCKNGFCERP